jgi:hypothetical protein
MRKAILQIFLMILFLMPAAGFGQNYSDYLILQNIGPYQLEAAQRVVGGYIGGPRMFEGAGVIAPAGHFYPDHIDKTYEAYYEGGSSLASATVQVTQHSGSESDKWLLHEVDKGFRTSLGMPGEEYEMRVVNGNTVMAFGSAGWTYRWVSGNKAVQIEYHDSQMTKPEPLDVVRAYLVKHPSTLTPLTSADLRTAGNKTTWIKDEMERRLWLCDKWFIQLQLQKVTEQQAYQESVKSMNIFLDYREKYYGMAAATEKNLLAGYLSTNNGTGIRSKLAEYKTWWQANKTVAISL